MRLTILGGGGFRVPLVYRALLDRQRSGVDGAGGVVGMGVDEVVLHDIDQDRMAAIERVLAQLAAGRAGAPRVRGTTDLVEAVRGADFVFSAIRVGGLHGRTVDERVALAQGVLGQETVGPGGICYALRTLPVALHVARTVAEQAPNAWVINFTNPVGVVTEAMSGVLGDRVIGICDSPMGLCRRVARALGVDPDLVWFDYFGLNHLGWLRGAYVGGRDRLPELFTDPVALASFEEGEMFGPWLSSLGMVPNEYLYYFYRTTDAVNAISTAPNTRGEFLLDQQTRFYRAVAEDPDNALPLWIRYRQEREVSYLRDERAAAGVGERNATDVTGGGYEGVALDLMAAIAHNERNVHVLNVRNRSALPDLDTEAVVEVPCLVGANGAVPVAVGAVPEHAAGLMRTVKAVERATIEAATTGSRAAALRAIALHPVVNSFQLAERILDGYLAHFPELTPLSA